MTRFWAAPVLLPRAQELVDIAALGRRELKALEQAAGLRDVVVRRGRLEVLADGQRLGELPAEPAQQGHTRVGAHHAILANRRLPWEEYESLATLAEGPLAQLVEQGTFNPKVAGSSPARPMAKALLVGVWMATTDALEAHARPQAVRR